MAETGGGEYPKCPTQGSCSLSRVELTPSLRHVYQGPDASDATLSVGEEAGGAPARRTVAAGHPENPREPVRTRKTLTVLRGKQVQNYVKKKKKKNNKKTKHDP